MKDVIFTHVKSFLHLLNKIFSKVFKIFEVETILTLKKYSLFYIIYLHESLHYANIASL